MSENPKINQLKIGDVTYDIAGGLDSVTDTDVTLSSELKTYYNVGKISNASGTNPVTIGNEGDSLRTVLTNLFVMTADIPTYSDPSISLSLSNNSSSIEYGKSVTVSATITTSTGSFLGGYYTANPNQASNTGITWNALNLESTNSTFNKIATGITAGNSFTVSTKSTYYAVANGGTIKGKAVAPSGYNQSSPPVYAKNNLGEATSVYIPGSATRKESSEKSTTISAGYIPYTYQLVTGTSVPNSLPTSNRSRYKPSSITVSGGSASGPSATYLYIFVPSGQSINSISSSGFGVSYSLVASAKEYVVNNGNATNFNVYRSAEPIGAGTFDIT